MDRAEDFERDRAGGVTGKILHLVVDSWFDAPTRELYEASYYGYDGFLQRGLAAITKVLAIADDPASRVRIVRNVGDLDAAERSGQLALVLGSEGGKLIEEDLANLEAFWRLGLRHIQLNWAMRNQIGASQSNESEQEQPGLTSFGFKVIERMNQLGMLIDVSHSAPQTIKDVLRTTTKPILNSHSGSRVLADKQQNLWDDQIRDMARNGGVIGIHFCSRLVLGVNDRQATIPDLLRQIRYVVDVGGIDVVALGPDFVLGNPPRDAHYKRNTNQDNITWTKGLESSDELPRLLPALAEAGFTAREVEKLLSGNLRRLLTDVLHR
jgi:membrane dipeptidase